MKKRTITRIQTNIRRMITYIYFASPIKHLSSDYANEAVLSGYAVKRVGLVKVPYANIVFNENVSRILTFCDHIYREANYRGHSLSYIQRSRLQRPPSKPIKLTI